jgi:hypothetical protein
MGFYTVMMMVNVSVDSRLRGNDESVGLGDG